MRSRHPAALVSLVVLLVLTSTATALRTSAAAGSPAAAQAWSPVTQPSNAAPEATGPDYTWVKTGGPPGGLGYDVRARPDRPDTMLVTDAYSGVNISVDGGRAWTASNTGIDVHFGPTGDSTPVFSLTIDPHNNNVVWAGTQGRKGIFKSTDGGRTWARKDNGVAGDLGVSLRGFTVDPINSDIVYAAGEISSVAWAGSMRSGRGFDLTKGMVYKTTDGGEHWTQIWAGDNLARYIWIDPGNPNILYVSTGFFDREAANTDAAAGQAGGVGILKSTDGGRTWRVLNQANGLGNLYVGSLFMHPTNPKILLAGTGNSAWNAFGGGGVYLTVDGGETWVQTLANDAPCSQIGAVEFSLSSPNIAYAAEGCAIHRSEDGGRTWRRFNDPARRTWGPSGMWAGFPIDIDVDPRQPRRLFVNVYGGGNFLSIDGGESWHNASQGYTGAQMLGVSVDPTDPATVYAGGRSGPFMSPDGGATWRGLNSIPETPLSEAAVFAVSPGDPQQILLSDSRHGRLFKSTDRGNTWRTVLNYSNPLGSVAVTNADQRSQEFTTIVFAPSDPHIVYAGLALTTCAYTNDPASCGLSTLAGVHQSTDGGTTWRVLTGEGLGLQNVLKLAVHPTSPDTIYAATGGRGVFKSTDGGRTWVSINQGLSIGYARSVAIDPRTPSTVYVGTEGSAVFKSTDEGATWRLSSAGLIPNAAIRSVLVDPTDSSIVWAGDYLSGVYRSADAGATWVRMNNGLSTRAVRDLAISADGRTLYAGTDGEGVFRLQPYLNWAFPGAPRSFVGSSAGSTVTLSWSAPETGGAPTAYTIEAGSGLGLANLASFSTGTTATTFETSGVGDGTYYVRARATNSAGRSGPSNEVQVVVGGSSAAPGAPSGLTASSSGSNVALNWTAPATGGAPTAYTIEAGSGSGLSDLANFSTGNTATTFATSGVGNGTYYVRVRATNSAGTSGPSNEAIVVVEDVTPVVESVGSEAPIR